MQRRRCSNIELYRIISMLLIVAHHYVVNSGLMALDGPMLLNPNNSNTIYLYMFGMWGKTGINCFLMITGYFMCTSSISIRKFIKLMLWIYLYKLVIYGVFLTIGYETVNLQSTVRLLMPVWDFNTNFTSCFIGFWLTIPFWNILIRSISKRQHEILLCLLLGMYTILGSIPRFNVSINYVTWFGVIFLIASYIRLYPLNLYNKKNLWAMLSIISILLGIISILVMHYIGEDESMFLNDSNKIFAVAIALTTFLWFKSMDIPYNKRINAMGSSTFGVLLIHANSDAMRHWLWKDFIDCVGHYNLPLFQLIGFSCGVVLAIFLICSMIDSIRIRSFEEPFFKWYDKKIRFQGLTTFLSK